MKKQILRRDMEKSCFRKGRALLRLSFLLLMLCLGGIEAWGQTVDYSGTYYIASDYQTPNTTTRNYDFTTLTNNFYLCPTENWISFDSSGETTDTWTTGDANPFLTTYLARLHANDPAPDTYDLTKAKWTIEYYTTESSKDYYYIKHSSGQYVVLNKKINGMKGNSPENRIRVHLETLSSEQLAVEATRNLALFAISPDGRSIFICPKTQSSVHLTVNNGNGDYLKGYGNNKGTLVSGTTTYGMEGTIGIYGNSNTDDNKYLYLEDVITRPTITYNSSNLIEITAPGSTAIYYTTNGTKPTASSGILYEGPFDPADGVTIIKAIAIVGGEESNVATYEPPFLLGSTHNYIIQSKQCQFYNLIPNISIDDNTKYVSTLNVPCETMAWHFEYAEDGYYYVVDNSGWYLYYTTTDNSNKYVYLKSSKDNSDDGYKFSITAHASGGFNLIPKGQTQSVSKYITGGSDAGLKPAKLDNNGTATSRWDLIPYSTSNLPQWVTAPFDNVSDDDNTFYYNIVSVSQSTMPIILNNDGDVRSQTLPDGIDERKTMWVIKKVGVADDDNELLDFYTFQNAYTGQKLYYNGNGRNYANNVLQLGLPSATGASEQWSHFVIVQTETGYNIIPRPIIDVTKAINRTGSNEALNCINRRGGGDVLGTFYDDGGGSRWTFSQVDFCMPPVFEESNGSITISCATNGAEIHYQMTDNSDPTSASTLYNNDTWSSSDTVRVKAIAIVKDGETVTASSDVVTLLNKPDITLDAESYTYKGTAWEPTVTKVSIGTSPNETIAPTTPTVPYTASYSGDRTNAGTTTATVTLTDADVSDLWYIWNATTNFTISPASVTVTADDKTKEYGTNDPELTATVEGMQNGESATELIHYTISRVAGENVGGTYAITPSGQATQGNYSVTYVPGELTITRKAVTVTANDIEKTYGDADPTLSATIAGLVNNDSESVISYTISRAEGENVGTYVITPTGATDQGNYTVTYPTGTLTINKKSLTVTANNKTITYGEAPANNGVTYGAFAPNEDENNLVGNLTYTYNYAQYEDVGSGSFAITPSGLTSDNYELTFVPGTLTVERKEVGIGGWSNTTVTYNGSAQAPTATVDTNDLINGDEGVEVTVTGGGINAGSYTATASGLTGGKAGNYKLPNPAPTSPFTINKAQLMAVTLGNNALTYNGTEQTVTITSVTAGDGAVVTVSDVPSEDYDVSGNSATNANTYTVTVTPKSPSTNYETGVSVSESYTIGQKSIGDGTDPATANGITINITWNDDESDPYIVEVKDGETLLTKGTDYAFSPSPTGGHDTKYYTVTIAGANNYKDSFSATYANVKFDSNGSEGAMYYGTFVADDDHATPEDMTPYIITSVADNTATALALDYIPANVPIVLMNPTYAKGFLVQSGTGEISTTGNLLEVQATNEEKATAFAYLLYKGEFVLNKAGTFKAGTVYLPVPAGGVSPARLKIIEDDIEGDNTGIENIEKTIDSQSGAWYTLDGRSLSSKPTKKGLYLQSGKKIVVK